MSTRAIIGKINKNGSIKYIYCHNDGHPSYVGALLVGFWNKSNINSLIDLGDLSCLGKIIGQKHDFNEFSNVYSEKGRDVARELPQIKEQWCVSYERDRGKKNCEPGFAKDIKQFKKQLEDTWCEWVYLFENKTWTFSNIEQMSGKRKPLILKNVISAIKEDYIEESWNCNIDTACELAGWECSNTVSVDK